MPSISESPYEITCTVTDDNTSDPAIENVTIFKIEMITPNNSPISSPCQSGDGQNEFTFLDTGVLTMNLKAEVTPSGIATDIKDKCNFTVGAIGSSKNK